MIGSLLRYFSVERDGQSVEIFNSCRSLTYLEAANLNHVQVNTTIGNCCCPATQLPEFETDGVVGAPWYDASVAESEQFFGLNGSLTIGQFNGGDRLTFTGFLLSSSDAGRVFGLDWLKRLLNDNCGSSRGKVFTHCGVDPADADAYLPVNERPSLNNRECCPEVEPEVLADWDVAEPYPDTGARYLDVSYVDGSLEPIDSQLPSCYGCELTFSFDVDSSYTSTDLIPVCDETVVLDPCFCKPVVFAAVEDDTCGSCVKSCECPPDTFSITTEDSGSAGQVDDWVFECANSTALFSFRWSCITPALPFETSVPVVELSAGSSAATARVYFWEAVAGIADPATCVGDAAYCDLAPLVPPVNVHVPAGATLILDGSTDSTVLECDGEQQTAGDLITPDEGSLRLPAVSQGSRVWVVVDFDCYNPPAPDFGIVVSAAGRSVV